MLGLQAPLFGTLGRGGRPARLTHFHSLQNQLSEAGQSLFTVGLLSSGLLGLDDHRARRTDPAVFHLEQTLFVNFRKRRRPDIEEQMYGGRNLVYVLPTRSLRTDGL